MKPLILVLLLLGACSSQWPASSYTNLPKETDVQAILGSVTECASNLVPYQGTVKLDKETSPWMAVLPEVLGRGDVRVSDSGVPFHTVVAKTAEKDAFVRVATPRGVCAQYLLRDFDGVLQTGGPVMVITQ